MPLHQSKINAPLLLAAAEKTFAQHCPCCTGITLQGNRSCSFWRQQYRYLFDMGHGIAIALFTMLPLHRFSIESYIGYMLL
jgi:hypothetical protein